MLAVFRLFAFAPALLLTMAAGGCAKNALTPVSDHFNGRTFHNPGSPMEKGFARFLKWRFTADEQPWPEFSELPVYDRPPDRVAGSDLRVSFVGHVTVLLQTRSMNILFDPVWSDRASPLAWLGPRRVHPPGIHFDDLPPIDTILISHNHYDHMDLPTIERLWQRDRPRIIAPLANEHPIHARNPEIRVETYDWGEHIDLATDCALHVEPMHHWSARGLFDRNRALWAAFVLATPDGNIYLVGDSGYGEGRYFRAARDKHGSFRLVLLPIGSYDPQWFMSYGHMNPEEALQAYFDLGEPPMLPIHYGMFPLADTGYAEPLPRLEAAMQERSVPQEKIRALRPGTFWMVPAELPARGNPPDDALQTGPVHGRR